MTESKNLTQIDSLVDLDFSMSMEDLLGGVEVTSNFKENTVLKGHVSDKKDNGALIDIGYKADGFVSKEEFPAWDDLKIQDEVEVFLEELEDSRDHAPVLSVAKALLLHAWTNLTENCEEGAIIKGLVKHRVKGGLIVDVMGVESFLPGSQIDLGPVKNMDIYVGEELELKVLKINQERKNVVVSRRELLEEARAEKRATLINEIAVGQVREGVVKNITDFGAFVDLDGIDGLLHITDMSWGRVSHPSEVVAINDKIEVMILDIDYDKQRLSLGLKQKSNDPWENIDKRYPKETKIKGKVVNVMPYGAFVEIEEGIEGLIHVSEMSWTKRVTKASEILAVGDEVEAVVLDVQKETKKISLGLRQTMENPWELVAEKCPVGTKIKGKVRNMTAYGAFVELEEDIDGMIHVSDMSWTRKINHPSEVLQKGQEVEAVIMEIDAAQRRISLGLKQLSVDPWSTIEDIYSIDQVVKGKITKVTHFGAFVALENDIDGLIHISQLSDDHVEKVKDVVKVGDDVEARVVKIDIDERRIGLSLRTKSDTPAKTTGNKNSNKATDADIKNHSGMKPGEELGGLGSVFDALGE
jgi:small subunit ribosomal protein S1